MPRLQFLMTLSLVITALSMCACSTVNTGQGKTIADIRIDGDITVFNKAETTFAQDLQQSAADPSATDKALKAFKTGRALLDLQCDRYLDAVGGANQSASNERLSGRTGRRIYNSDNGPNR